MLFRSLWGVRINESPDNATFYQRTNALAHALDDSRQTGGVRNRYESEFLEDVFTFNDFRNPSTDIRPPIHGRYLVTEFGGHMSDILEAMRQGRFYASSGLELADYWASDREIHLELADAEAQIELIGSGGQVLDSRQANQAAFALGKVSSPYVRIRATASDGRQLWTQPAFR